MLRQMLTDVAARAKTFGAMDMAARYNPLLRGKILRQLPASGCESDEASLTDVQRKLTTRMIAAAQATAYGKDRPNTIEAWPVLRKAELFKSHASFINRRIPVRIPASTGGTSGTPLKLWRSLESVAAEQLFIDRLAEPYGISLRTARIATLRADNIKSPQDTQPPFGRVSHAGRRLTLSSKHLSSESIGWYHSALTDHKPEILAAYPNAAASLMHLLSRAGLSLTIPLILLSSETVQANVHTALEDFFHATVINYYGQAERVCLAYSSEPGVFYFNPCYGRVELEEVESSADASGRHMRIIATGFWNRCMPLIRYDTGDMLLVPQEYGKRELQEVCLGLRQFSGILGREGEFLLTRDGVKIIGLNNIPREVEHIAQMQLIQATHNTVEIRALVLPGFGDNDSSKLLAQTRAKLPGDFTVTLNLQSPPVTTNAGKVPFIVKTF